MDGTLYMWLFGTEKVKGLLEQNDSLCRNCLQLETKFCEDAITEKTHNRELGPSPGWKYIIARSRLRHY